MVTETTQTSWEAGSAPVCVIMISLNEGHNMDQVLTNLKGWASQVFLVDSYSRDDTVDIALRHGVTIIQRKFRGYSDQWNFALENLPITSAWTMKMDPDERLSPILKANLESAFLSSSASGFSLSIRLWLMGRVLPPKLKMLRVWRTGSCRFTNIEVNEHALVDGPIEHMDGNMEHLDSPDFSHWFEKQNRYTTTEAEIAYRGASLAAEPKFLGSALERRMWLKKNFRHVPFRFFLLFLYNWLWQGAWRAGYPGYIWARLRSDVMRFIEYKRTEMEYMGRIPEKRPFGSGEPDLRVEQFD